MVVDQAQRRRDRQADVRGPLEGRPGGPAEVHHGRGHPRRRSDAQATGQIELTEPGELRDRRPAREGTTTAPASPDPMAIPVGVPNVADGMFSTFTVIEPDAS